MILLGMPFTISSCYNIVHTYSPEKRGERTEKALRLNWVFFR
jgi:hypothetical protein